MDKQVRNPVTGWWETVSPPRSVAVLVTLAHVLVALAGVTVIFSPPLFLAAGLGDGFLTLYWGALLAFGGTVGAASVLPSVHWAERIGIAAQGLALLLYAAAILELQQRTGSNVGYQALLNVALFLHVAIRWERVRHSLKDRDGSTRRRRSR